MKTIRSYFKNSKTRGARKSLMAFGLIGVLSLGSLAYGVVGASPSPTPCNNLIVPQHMVQGHLVGETSCEVTDQSTVQNNKGQNFNEVNIGIGGTAFGYLDPNTQGNTRKDLTDVPNVLFPQFGITSWSPAIGTYTGTATASDAGAGITVLYPQNKADWNGKMFFAVHGQSNDTPIGAIVPQAVGAAVTNDTFNNLYADEMINQGYAVVYSRRPAVSGVPSTIVGTNTTLDESLNDNVDTLLSFLQSGQKLVQQQMGKSPSETYWYGHSAGVIVGRLLNYSGLNKAPNGKPYINGFLDDDAGGGLPLPVSMPEGQVLGEQGNEATFPQSDLLFQTPQQKTSFTKEINFAHDMYESYHTWLSEVSYLQLKRENTKLDDQLGVPARTYEVAGVSHIPNSDGSPTNTLDMDGLISSAITNLDAWVTHNTQPPASIVNTASVSTSAPIVTSSNPAPDAKTNNVDKQTSVQLPPLACPTGIRFSQPAPNGSPTSTGYAAYDGSSLEPVNAGGQLVDVNNNGVRDTMPTMTQAWRSLGLLGQNQQLTKGVYVSCVQQSVNKLTSEHLLSQSVADWYVQTASSTYPNLPW
jgi:hypothetical protein